MEFLAPSNPALVFDIVDHAVTVGGRAQSFQMESLGAAHFVKLVGGEPPPLKWSAPIVRKRRTINGHHETQARRDCREVTAG
jgi:hypothetical protein